jgi:hypothetical protein
MPPERPRTKSSSHSLFEHKLIQITARVDASIARNARIVRFSVITAAVLLVIWWIVLLITGLNLLIGGLVSLVILGGCTFAYFTFNPYDHR